MTVTGRLHFRSVATVVILAALVVLWAQAAFADLCPRVKYVELGDKTIELGWTMGISEADIPNFGGYRVWLRENWHQEEFELVAEYVYGEDNPDAAGYWPFVPFYQDSIRVAEGDFFKNAFPYEVSVTAFEADDPNTVNEECLEDNIRGVLYPRQGVQSNLDGVECIPNPYRASAEWEYGGERRVTFVGLPGDATIRIYTVSGALVRTLDHDDSDSDLGDLEFWDLKNSDGESIAPGVYIWAVDAGEFGTKIGKVMIIK